MADQADGMRTALARTKQRLDRYTLQLQEHGLESADREVRWLTELIEDERGTATNAAPKYPATETNNKEIADGFADS
jgi:hypothetical protein